MYSEEVEK